MTLFNSDLEALIYISIIAIILIIINKLIMSLVTGIKKFPSKYRIIISFILKIIIILIIAFLIIEGLPSFKNMDPTYQAILTGSISTAIAFASSGIFSNVVAGIVLLIVRPFEVGDLVKIKMDKGIVRSINLTRVVIETFDYIIIEKSNTEVISSPIVNYTIKMGKIKNVEAFIKKIVSPVEKGLYSFLETPQEEENDYITEIKTVYGKFNKKSIPNLFAYTFRMTFPYRRFRVMIEEVSNLSKEYQDKGIFYFKPRFHVIDLGFRITVKFRILTISSEKIFDFQSNFTHDIYKIIYENSVK